MIDQNYKVYGDSFESVKKSKDSNNTNVEKHISISDSVSKGFLLIFLKNI